MCVCVCVIVVLRAGTTAQRRKTWHSTVAMSSSPCVSKLSLQCSRPTEHISPPSGEREAGRLFLSLLLFFFFSTYTAEKNKSVAWIKQRKISVPTEPPAETLFGQPRKKQKKNTKNRIQYRLLSRCGDPGTSANWIVSNRCKSPGHPGETSDCWRRHLGAATVFNFFFLWGGGSWVGWSWAKDFLHSKKQCEPLFYSAPRSLVSILSFRHHVEYLRWIRLRVEVLWSVFSLSSVIMSFLSLEHCRTK